MQQTETVSPSDQTALLELNQAYIRSVQDSDVRRFNEILADDFLCSLPDGSLVDRSQFLVQARARLRAARSVLPDRVGQKA